MTHIPSDVALQRRQELRTGAFARYKRMLEIRLVEDRIVELGREGNVDGTAHTCQGHEAVSVGIGAATNVDDYVACTYRGHGHALALGVTPEAVIAEVLGRPSGCAGGLGGSMHLTSRAAGLLPTFAIVGGGIPVACGVGLSAQVRGTDQIGVSIFGDGAANIGAFHESLNLAAVWKLPTVFIIENNLYGEYSAIGNTTPIADLADRAGSYGMPGAVVDGQDVDAVLDSVTTAVERARSGSGPSLLEMKTYRYIGHSHSDPAKYQPAEELAAWKERDPLLVAEAKLVEQGVPTSDIDQARTEILAELDEISKRIVEEAKPDRSAMFNHVFAGEGN